MICLLKMWMFLSKLFNYQRVTRRNWDLETNLRADQQERKNYPEKLSYIDEYKKWIQDICCHEFWSSLAWLLSVSKNRVAHSIPCLIPYVYSLYNGPKLIYPPLSAPKIWTNRCQGPVWPAAVAFHPWWARKKILSKTSCRGSHLLAGVLDNKPTHGPCLTCKYGDVMKSRDSGQ
jgi:hypothetical protein